MIHFKLDDNLMGLNVALINAGSVFGGLFAGQVCDQWGRKAGIALSAAITVVAVIIQAAAVHEAMFCIGRFLLGASITVNGAAAPTWVMEMAHPRYRGILGGMYMAIWYFIATIVSGISIGTYFYDTTWTWRGLAIGQVVPSLLALAMLPLTPESPRWLISQDRHEEALMLLATLHGRGDRENPLVQAEYHEISSVLSYEKSLPAQSFKTLISPAPNLKRFMIVIVLNIAAQVIGSNIVSSFIGVVLESAGITDTHQQLVTNLGINIFNFFCAIAGSFAMERLGRKGMLFYTTCLMTFFLVLMAILSALYSDGSNKSASNAMVAIIFLFLGSYSFAWTPLTFVYPVEIFNYTQRAKGLAVGQMACYAFGFVNQYTTPIAIDNIGWRYYAINAAWDVVICAIIWFFFVETKSLALEEVDKLFDGKIHADGVFVGRGDDIRLKADTEA
ncbi:putative hexose transporter protein [Phaeoacremonium minimum UCRPA7]|uniref:Putative hexose transporter protein n=1 Tax=Phaeoacremonium minimum (strain UCR-PA7) TaxID=1286976 RepID=R8BXI8_PHAM7|nr:putative hexose transporter protein [Phaeoacremonium minimum UCRPA7]EOO04057.1 putative hexose transporter protein [Phaeoacremonium minimum UCRPA7]